jgi:hypothetical protein
MNLDRATERAQSVRGPKEAARLYNDIEAELGLGDYTEEQATNGEHALSVLEERYPGVRQAAHDIETPPAISRSANENLRSDNGHKPALAARTPAERRAEQRAPSTPRRRLSRATAIHARPRRRSGGGGGLFTRRASSATVTTGQLIISGVEGIVGLVLLGLLVSPKGSEAFTGGAGLIGRLLERIANPFADPLAGIGHSSTGSGGGHDIPIVPARRVPKDPNNPNGPKKLIPRPGVRFPVLPPINAPLPVTPPEIPIIDVPVPGGGPFPEFVLP